MPDSAVRATPAGPADRAAGVCALLVVAAVLFFAGWQLVMPAGFVSVQGVNRGAVVAWWSGMSRSPPPQPVPSLAIYAAWFRGSLILGWAAYAAMLWLTGRGAGLDPRWRWPLAIPVVTLLALASPASLSTDVFAYVGYGRLAVVHGLNPHLHTQAELIRLGDPSAPFLHWPIASPYGPLWTLLSMAVVWICSLGADTGSITSGVLIPVIALKVVAGAALLAAAAWARQIVARTEPRWADAVFFLVALNPLLLVEGPGNGHNDLVMMALLLAGWAAHARGRPRRGAVLVGLAAAIKLIPLLMVPWLITLAAREAPPHWRSRLGAATLVLVLSLAPVVAAYAPFWSGARTLDGLVARWELGSPTRSPPPPPSSPSSPSPPPSSSDRPREISTVAGSVGRVAVRIWPALLVYLWASLAICIGQGDAVSRLATVWSCTALASMIFAAGLWFPWYLAWFWIPVVFRFTRLHLALMAFALPFSLLLMFAYATSPG